ncbi:prepilin-type N-terminal cleavage/methylation domain-containing protein [Candidatus Saccharibacteria bacterium TM7i]|nr:prepilin-type N-terminal cleavage/methylation domain-containing protein [Candidatus Saccharibacteria bacterium TM7i]
MRKGFTIVELLIVIVVIAVLAAVTVVAYNGITNKAQDSAVQAELDQFGKKIIMKQAEDGVGICRAYSGCESLQWLNDNMKPSFLSNQRISMVIYPKIESEGGWYLFAVSQTGRVFGVTESGIKFDGPSVWNVWIDRDDEYDFGGTIDAADVVMDGCGIQGVVVFDTEHGVWRNFWHPYAGC